MQSELSPSDTSCFKDRRITRDVIKLSRSLTTSPLFSQGFVMLGVEGLVQLKSDSYIRMHLFFLSEHDVRWALFLSQPGGQIDPYGLHSNKSFLSNMLPSAHLVFRFIVAKCQSQWYTTITTLRCMCVSCFVLNVSTSWTSFTPKHKNILYRLINAYWIYHLPDLFKLTVEQ